MKNIVISIFCIFFTISMFAQQANPVSWEVSAEELSDKEYILSFKASIENSWYIYSQHIETRPPIPTSFLFNKNDDFELKGEVLEIGEMIDIFDETFEANIRKFANEVTFQAIVKAKKDDILLTGKIEYMVCDDQKCLPPEFEPFDFKLVSKKSERMLASRNTKAAKKTSDVVVSTPSFAVTSPKNYSTSGTIPPPDQHIIIAPHKPIDVSKIGEMQSFEEANGLPEMRQQQILNQEKTVILDEAETMVGSNITAFMDMSFLEDKKETKKTAKAKQTKKKSDERKAIAEAKIETPKVDEQKSKPKPFIDPVKWKFNMVDLKNGTYELVATASIDDNWYIYSKENNSKEGPFPATLVFDKNDNIEFVDEKLMEQGNLRNDYDRVFDKQVNRYTHQVTFKRTVRFKDNVAVNGKVRYMAANADRYLMPKTKSFSFNQDLSVEVSKVSANNIAGWWRWMLAVASIIFLAFVSSQENVTLATSENEK